MKITYYNYWIQLQFINVCLRNCKSQAAAAADILLASAEFGIAFLEIVKTINKLLGIFDFQVQKGYFYCNSVVIQLNKKVRKVCFCPVSFQSL